MDKGRSTCRAEQGNGEPDRNSCQSTEHHGEQKKEAGVFSGVFKDCRRVLPQPFHFGEYQKESTAHGKMGNVHMDNGNKGNECSAAEEIEEPYRIIHDCTSLSVRTSRTI